MNESRPPTDPREVEQESKAAAEAVNRSLPAFLKSIDLVSASYLAQVLIALWDSGMYEYCRRHERVNIEDAATDLGLDESILRQLLEYLVGRGLMKAEQDRFVLTDRGRPYWNYVTRGALTCHLGGYNPLLTHLGPLLRKEIELGDPGVDRLERLVALGAGHTLIGTGMIPWILNVIQGLGGNCNLDLGCGTGELLVQLALKWPQGRGVGIDTSAEAIAEARKKAEEKGVVERVRFYRAALSAGPMVLDQEILDDVDSVTAMFILHEFGGRGGTGAIAEVIASLRRQLPGRKLVMVEGARADAIEFGAAQRRTYSQLDYSFIHPLSRQGPLRTPAEWQQIIEAGGGRLLERIDGFNLVPAWVSIYLVGLG